MFLLSLAYKRNIVGRIFYTNFNNITSCPADSRPRELSPYYWPLPDYLTCSLKIIKIGEKLWLGQTFPLIFPLSKKLSTKSKLKIKEYVCQVSSKSLQNCDLYTGTDRHPTKEKFPLLRCTYIFCM